MRTRVRAVGTTLAIAAMLATSGVVPARASSPTVTPKYGGRVTVGIFDTFTGFCVGNNLANSALMAARTVYETLFEKTVSGATVGLLATGSSRSADMKTWTITLRRGVKFHDGTPFDADAVVANFHAIRGVEFLESGGQKAYTLGTAIPFTANINSVTAVNSRTVRFTLDRAQNDLPTTLYASGRFFMRAPSQLSSATSCVNKPAGTGAFVSSKWEANSMVVTRNKSYWRRDPATNAILPYLDRITFKNVKEASQRSAAVRTGTFDAAMFSSATDSTFIIDLRGRRNLVKEFKSSPEYYTALWLNQAKSGSPFASRDARVAVARAFDTATYVKLRMQGQGQIPDSIVGPSNIMYNHDGFIPYNLTRAREAALRYKNATGKTLEFTMPADTSIASQNNARFIKQLMAKAGIKMNVLTEETAVIISRAFNAARASNDYDALPLLLLEGTDVSFNLPFLVTNTFAPGSTNPARVLSRNFGSLLNLTKHTDTVVDRYFFAGQATTTPLAAKLKYRKATQRVQSQAIIVPIARQFYSLFASPRLRGIGVLQLQPGKTQRIVTNWGIDWTGVWKA
jgi:ABC-type transport system substrate-binding protein